MSFPPRDDLDRARRRPEGERLLVYLDQSSLSGMVRKPDAFGELQDLLMENVHAGHLICVRSPAHYDESVLAKEHTCFALDRLARDLSPGVRFLTAAEIENNEIRAAARELLGKTREELWQEAFTADPHTSCQPLVAPHGGATSARHLLPPTGLERAEVEHQKDKENALTEAYREAGERFSFEEICLRGIPRRPLRVEAWTACEHEQVAGATGRTQP